MELTLNEHKISVTVTDEDRSDNPNKPYCLKFGDNDWIDVSDPECGVTCHFSKTDIMDLIRDLNKVLQLLEVCEG